MKKPTKKKRQHFLLVRKNVFPFDVLFSTAPHDEVTKYIKGKGYDLNDEEFDKLHMEGTGRTVMLRGGQTIVRLKLQKTQLGIDVADLAHEVEHAVFMVMERIGVRHTDASDEVFGYYTGYLMREAMLFFDEQTGKK